MVICTSGNAIVTSDNGLMIRYISKCPNCGHVDNQERICSVSGRVTDNSTYSCSKCHKPVGAFKFERR